MEERLGEILNWLKLHFLVDYVTSELRKLLLEVLKKMLAKEWDGSSASVQSLKEAIGKKQYKSASGSVRNKIDKGDIENWDLTAVSHILRALNSEWVSVEEKVQMEAAVQTRNHLADHPSKVILKEEFCDMWQKLIGLLSFLNVPTARIDEIEEKIKFRTSDLSSLFSPSVSNAEANKLKDEGNTAFRNADYSQAIEKFDNALKVVSLKEAERGVLFSNRSAAFLQTAKAKQDHERKDFAKRAKDDAKKAAHLQPMWLKAHFRLGEAYKLLEKYEKAITAYDEALSLDPSLEFVGTQRDECRQVLAVKTTSPVFKKFLDDIRPLVSRALGKLQTLFQVTDSESSKYCDDSPINDDYFKNPAIQNAIQATHVTLTKIQGVSREHVKAFEKSISQRTIQAGNEEAKIVDYRNHIATWSQTRTSLQSIVLSLQESIDHTYRLWAAGQKQLDSERIRLEAAKELQNLSLPFLFFWSINIGRFIVSDQDLRDIQDNVNKLRDNMQSNEQSKNLAESSLRNVNIKIAATEKADRNASAKLKKSEAALGRLKLERFFILQFEEKLKTSAAFLETFYCKVNVLYESNRVTMFFNSIIISLKDLLMFLNQNLDNQLPILATAQDLEIIRKLFSNKLFQTKSLAHP